MNTGIGSFFKVVTVVVALLAGTSVLVASEHVGAASAPIEDEQMPNPMVATVGLHGLILKDGGPGGGDETSVSVMATSTIGGTSQFLCTSVEATPCATAENYFYRAVLAPCSTTIIIDCIESVSSTSSTGDMVPGIFKEMFPKKGANEFDGSVQNKIPMGRTPSLWTLSGAPHAFGSEYAVLVSVAGDKISGNKRSLAANIIPISVQQTTCDPTTAYCLDTYRQAIDSAGNGSLRFAGAMPSDNVRCSVWTEGSKCGLGHAFPVGFSYTVKLRLASEPVGWLHGRMEDPSITFATADGKTDVTISAKPVRVPSVAGTGMWDSLPAKLQQWFTDNCPRWCGTRVDGSTSLAPLQRNAFSTPVVYRQAAFDELKLWTEYIKDSAFALTSQWRVRTLAAGEMGSASECIKNASGVTGIVTTNSLLYSEGPPTFDTTNKTLNYKVASPHFEKDGTTEFKGVYNLTVRDDIAECLYKFSEAFAAPKNVFAEEEEYFEQDVEQYIESTEETFDDTSVEAEFSDEEGIVEEVSLASVTAEESALVLTEPAKEPVVARVAADVITELLKTASVDTTIDLLDGWFKFSAKRFSFSSPTLKVQMGLRPMKSVTCISGSLLKKVSASIPKCPLGFSPAVTQYCIKGKTINVVVGVKPQCAKKFVTATAIKCAKAISVKRVIAVKPVCPRGFGLVSSIVCIKGNAVRRVTMASPTCAGSYTKALTLSCAKGKKTQRITALIPKCPKGYKAKK